MPDRLHVSLFESSEASPLGDGAQDALDFCLLRLYVRHLSYYTARVAGMRPVAGTKVWRGCCPFCDGDLGIDALSGWASCSECAYQGEVYALEFLLFGENAPERWEACCRQADALMAGPLAEALEGIPADIKAQSTAR